MNILVTGCAGFIGSNLTQRLLNENHRVTGIDNFDPFYSRYLKENNMKLFLGSPEFTFYEADITDPLSFQNIKDDIDFVVHLAAKAGVRPSIDFPAEYTRSNIFGTQNLLDWMVTRDIRKYIFASSSSIYGENHSIPFSESLDVNEVISPYAFTKKCGEILNYTYHHLYNIDTVNLRLFTVYGPRQRPDLAIRKFCDQISCGEPITVFGNGTSSRDYTYIDDILFGITSSIKLLGTNCNLFETINLGSSFPVTILTLIKVLSEALGKEPEIIYKKQQPGDVSVTYADISKATRLLSYKPQTTFKDGIRKFVDWYKQHQLTIPLS